MANRLLTVKEFHASFDDIVTKACKKNGITVKAFYEAIRKAWNKRLREEERIKC